MKWETDKYGWMWEIGDDGERTGKRYKSAGPNNANTAFDFGAKKGAGSDKYRSNNLLRRGNLEAVNKAFQRWLETGKIPGAAELGLSEGAMKNIIYDVKVLAGENNINFEEYTTQAQDSRNAELAGETGNEYNPYLAYMENKEVSARNNELGLLKAQTEAGKQNAQISAQEAMINQATLKDSIIDQIKTDRLTKMRQGISPMQIAQENLQFMVGNINNNNQEVANVNKARLAATQQEMLNPYMAFKNAQESVTGGQGYGAVASGLAATDAGDVYIQAKRLKASNPTMTWSEALQAVQGG